MNDLISRQDAIRLAEQGQIQGFAWQFKKLCALPTAEPRKKGKWIKLNNSCTIRCNQCGQEMTSLCDIQLPNYCLNCGSYNGGEEE